MRTANLEGGYTTMRDTEEGQKKDTAQKALFLTERKLSVPSVVEKKAFDRSLDFSSYQEVIIDDELQSAQAIIKFIKGSYSVPIKLFSLNGSDSKIWGVSKVIKDFSHLQAEDAIVINAKTRIKRAEEDLEIAKRVIQEYKAENGKFVKRESAEEIKVIPIREATKEKRKQNNSDTEVTPIVKQAGFLPFANLKSKIAEFNIKEYMSFVWCNRAYRLVIISLVLATILGSSLFLMIKGDIITKNIVFYKNLKIEVKK